MFPLRGLVTGPSICHLFPYLKPFVHHIFPVQWSPHACCPALMQPQTGYCLCPIGDHHCSHLFHPGPSLHPAHHNSSCFKASSVAYSCQAKCHCRRQHIFKPDIHLDYIGHHNFASANYLQMTIKQLRMLTLNFSMRGHLLQGNLDMLFSQYLLLTPLLPASHVSIWGINLFNWPSCQLKHPQPASL